jgi:hypothetical protein
VVRARTFSDSLVKQPTPRAPGLPGSRQGKRHRPYSLSRPRGGLSSSTPAKCEGVARQVAQPCLLVPTFPFENAGAPLGAPPRQACASLGLFADVLPYGAGPRFSWTAGLPASVSSPAGPFGSQTGEALKAGRAPRHRRQPAPGRQPLVAAGRSPGAARVRKTAFVSRPRAPHPIPPS